MIVRAPIPAAVFAIHVKVGDAVRTGDEVIVLESMKMEIGVATENAGVVTAVFVEAGSTVQQGDELIEVL